MPGPDGQYTDEELLELLRQQGIRSSAPSMEIGPITSPMPQQRPTTQPMGDVSIGEPVVQRAPPPMPPAGGMGRLARLRPGAPEETGELGRVPVLDGGYDAGTAAAPGPSPLEAPPPQNLAEGMDEDTMLAALREQNGAPPPGTQPNPYGGPPPQAMPQQAPPQATPPPPRPDPRTVAPRVQAPDPGGRPDMYGHEDETGFDPLAQARKVAELARARGPQQPQQQDYLQGLMNDKDMARVWASNTIFGGRGDNVAAANVMNQRQQQALQIAQARQQQAQQNQPVDPATAQSMAMAGYDPEIALNTLRNSPVVKNLGNLGTTGVRLRGQDINREKTNVQELGKYARQEQQLAQQSEAQEGKNETQLAVADRYAQAREQGRPPPVDPSRILASHLMQLGLPPERAQDIAQNPDADTSDLPSFLRNQIASARIDAQSVAGDPRKAAGLAAGNMGKRVGTEVSSRGKMIDPAKRLKIRTDYDVVDSRLKQANDGWKTLASNPRALEAYVKLGTAGKMGEFSKAGFSAEEQAAAAKLTAAITAYAFSQGGKALTGTEREMLGESAGVNLGAGVSVFRSPKVLSEFLKSLNDQRKRLRSAIDSTYPGVWEN